MKRSQFSAGVVFALAAALLGAAAHHVLPPLFGRAAVEYALISGLGLAYVFFLLHCTPERVGRVTTLAGWTLASLAGWLWLPGVLSFLALNLGLIWLVRALYHQAGVLAALADLGLNAVALLAAAWALSTSGSLFLGIWSFFLVQALFTAIPPLTGKARAGTTAQDTSADRFAQAHRNAESALRKLSNAH